MTCFAEIQQSAVWYDFADPAALHYSDELEYHNWGRACTVVEQADTLATHCLNNGLYLERDVLIVAAAWRGAGYHEDHAAQGFATKEQYSAALAADYLRTEGATEEFIAKVDTAILGTTHKAVRDSLAALVLHRADIADVGAEYQIFASNNYKLLLEARRERPELRFDEWRASTNHFLEFVIAESLVELPKLHGDTMGHWSFPEMATRNRAKFMQDTDEKTFSKVHHTAA